MKKVKIYSIIIALIFVLYVAGLCYISVKMNAHPYKIKTSLKEQVMYEVKLEDKDKPLYVPVIIENKSNRLISSNNNMNIGYHLYSVDEEGKQVMLSWDNKLSYIEDIFNNETGLCNVELMIPEKAGKYIYYIDVLEKEKCWFSEKGVLTIPVTVEVK